MRSTIVGGLVTLAALGGTASVSAQPLNVPVTYHHAKVSHAGPVTKRYSALWHACHKKAACDAGRNIRRYGVKSHNGIRHATKTDYRVSIARYDRWLHPPVARLITSPVATNTVATATTASYSGGMPACTWQPESGGSYTASNPSGAYGKYQIMPLHYGAGGVCAGMGKSPGEQEICARRVFASSGAGAWVNC